MGSLELLTGRGHTLDKARRMGLASCYREFNEVAMSLAVFASRHSRQASEAPAAFGVVAAGAASSCRLWWRCSLLAKGVARA